ncbi:FAD-dependent 2-octaprenylphenol hydroxylase [Testudinibacter sp. TR-2022]|uniref:FAD-dependent monooxygenase n=1 Tax=Testudinibacter sp. TR-2022 TaxID=2585029 RepID=UPI00111AF5B7|nr:FAD-dependent monooxygenase [Testudinibacter sp. TR-2022]TNH00782.1 FAD-dependent 2-octaprenylphenol hydroxylase [Pasteurellaceae bacterium Phil31]TNH09595.1 FAD-dependent 2-octaprenylphenol hydroxylase [Testudinibacter sp. TR-2022]TNH13067.1 FAD-dependent 2-octaprenylphenol hydroxylase [Testudinibacter sp. TR-2022]TNH13195.1 FAD-dependent 2-octaprenylphenol hydroxylase [Testudinibacter sp. TR-2022]TNH18438.1 FAD-dependent 2-octaprenylphenol hydroxylase [Testudinibacter sp. TR-2022]
MKNADVVIIGGGMVGLALAAALENSACQIVIVEAFAPDPNSLPNLSNRVSALNLASQKMLHQFGVWRSLKQGRCCDYSQMEVWEKDSFAKIDFDAASLGLDQLGYIIENQLIRHHLWQKITRQTNVEILHGKPKSLNINQQCALLTLEDGTMLTGKLVVGADGANSWLRQQTDIPLNFRDYGHRALVCNVETVEPHLHSARQIFSHDSILAFLPLQQPHLCSIVWSQPPEAAEQHLNMDDQAFNKALNIAFDNRLGLCNVVGKRQTIPLTARYARDFVKPRIALIGDAAHTIHPLAGLGVNLGFMDAMALAQEIEKNLQQHVDIGELRYLRHYERWRKSEAVKMLVAMQGFKSLFNDSNPLKKLLRGVGMTLTDKLPIVKDQLMAQALGLNGDLPQKIKQMPNDELIFS